MNWLHLKTSEQREKFKKGLCVQCGNDTFYEEESLTMSALGTGGKFIVCKECDDTYSSLEFTPKRLV